MEGDDSETWNSSDEIPDGRRTGISTPDTNHPQPMNTRAPESGKGQQWEEHKPDGPRPWELCNRTKDGGLLYENTTEKKRKMKRTHNSSGGQQPSSNGRAPASLAVPRGELLVARGRVCRASQGGRRRGTSQECHREGWNNQQLESDFGCYNPNKVVGRDVHFDGAAHRTSYTIKTFHMKPNRERFLLARFSDLHKRKRARNR
jgi:hypothetical protein